MAQIFKFRNARPNEGPGKVHAATTSVRPASGGHRYVGKNFVRGVLYLCAGLFGLSMVLGALAR